MLNTGTLIYAICREMLPYQARDYCRSHACLGKPPTFDLQHTSSCSSSHRLLNLPSCQETSMLCKYRRVQWHVAIRHWSEMLTVHAVSADRLLGGLT